MNMTLKQMAASILDPLRFLDCYGAVRWRISPQGALIAMYHSVHPSPPPWLGNVVAPPVFERQIEYATRAGHVVPLDWLVRRICSGASIQPRTICITFDDGYRDNFDHAYPILKRQSIPATVFLVTGWVGQDPQHYRLAHLAHTSTLDALDIPGLGPLPLTSEAARLRTIGRMRDHLRALPRQQRTHVLARILRQLEATPDGPPCERLMLTWDEVRALQRDGVVFGAHTVNHVPLIQVPEDDARKELSDSKTRLEDELNVDCGLLAYPYGAFDRTIVRLADEAGFTAAFTTLPMPARKGADLFTLGRVDPGATISTFKGQMSGLHPDLVELATKLRAGGNSRQLPPCPGS